MKLRNIATFDCETTILNEGSPFTQSNKLCLLGIKDIHGYTTYDIEYSGKPYGSALKEIKQRLEAADLVVGFNLKFDLHWITRYVPDILIRSVFDCQLAEFLLSSQREVFPSLDGTCNRYGLGSKHDVVKLEYWNNGIDTPLVPPDILEPYLKQDVELTEKLFNTQKDLLQGNMRKLFWLQCQDLLILQEMEKNGLLFDKGRAAELGKECQERLGEIDVLLRQLAGTESINFNSDDQLSCLLYGGFIPCRYREVYTRELKSGEVVQRERWSVKYEELPRLVKPLPRTEGAASKGKDEDVLQLENMVRAEAGKAPIQRLYSVAEPVLRRLRPTKRGKKIIDLLLERAKVAKLDSTYYTGLIKKMDEHGWEDGYIHGKFNQVVARTGRLSSSDPNLQNIAGDMKVLFKSRYAS